MIERWREWPREQQVILYIVGTLDALKRARLIEGGSVQLAEKAVAVFMDMEQSGFELSDEEVQRGLSALHRHAHRDGGTR